MRRPITAALTVVVLAGAGCTSTPKPEPTPATTREGPTGAYVNLPRLTMPRAAHTATALPDGRVLVAGGCTVDGCGGTPAGGRTELYDPRTRRFAPGPAMVRARAGHTATALADGRVLFAGGYPDEGRPPLSSVEIFDPRGGTFTEVATMASGRGAHSATRMRDGRVLIVGGVDGTAALSTVEIFDPATNRIAAAARLPAPRATHGAAGLADGRVLVAGGQTGVGHGVGLTGTAALYDPTRNAWQRAGDLDRPTYKLAIAPLPGGGALIVGGQLRDDPAARLATTEIFDPATGAFGPGPTMSEPRYKISDAVVALADGRVVIAGGFGVDVYADGRLRRVAGGPGVERQFPAAAPLPGGTVLVTGGYTMRTRVTDSAILVDPT